MTHGPVKKQKTNKNIGKIDELPVPPDGGWGWVVCTKLLLYANHFFTLAVFIFRWSLLPSSFISSVRFLMNFIQYFTSRMHPCYPINYNKSMDISVVKIIEISIHKIRFQRLNETYSFLILTVSEIGIDVKAIDLNTHLHWTYLSSN